MTCDKHDFGNVRDRDLALRDIGGLEHDSGLPKQLSAEIRCRECGLMVSVDYNLAFIDGSSP